AAQERHQVLAEVERAQLGQGEGLGQPLLVPLDQPPDLAAVRALVEEREAGLLQGLDVAADGALGDSVLVGQVLRGRVAPGLDPLEDPPLANDFGVTHDSDPLRSLDNRQATGRRGVWGARRSAPHLGRSRCWQRLAVVVATGERLSLHFNVIPVEEEALPKLNPELLQYLQLFFPLYPLGNHARLDLVRELPQGLQQALLDAAL